MSDQRPSNAAVARPPQAPPQRASLASLLSSQASGRGATPIPPSLQAKLAAIASKNAPATPLEDSLKNVSISEHPSMRAAHSYPPTSPTMPRTGLAGRRLKPGLKLTVDDSIFTTVTPQGGGAVGAGLGAGRPPNNPPSITKRRPPTFATPFANFGKIVDPSGALNFKSKAVLHASGVDFSSGASFAINMGQLRLHEELGKGNYGTVKKVLHVPTNVAMAMKEIRLELDEAKLNAILMELDVLHRAVAPEIVEFYGAFFIESCVYYCMEYMDAGSLDKLHGLPVPEDVLARIAGSMVRGLKFLKDELQIIHRDVKPTNVLANRKGEVKLCDFGVSGQLEKSMAKTNIGCQSYMAPERIRGESQNNIGTYTVASDVWSLGLSVVEIGLGRYPYPPETYSNVFAQLSAIVRGDTPLLPNGDDDDDDDSCGSGNRRVAYSQCAHDWVARCLVKAPEGRATYAGLLNHRFLLEDAQREVDMAGWVERALAHRSAQQRQQQDATTAPPPPALPSSDTMRAVPPT